MKPTNNKSMYHTICGEIEKLINNEITVEKAKGEGILFKRAIECHLVETERTKTLVLMREHNKAFNDDVDFRNIEGKPFDNIE